MLIHQYLEKNASERPDKTAVIFQEESYSYKEINTRADYLASSLINAGLQKGDRVAVFLDNSIETIVSVYAILKAGGVFSTLSPTLKSKKLEYIINNSDALFLISHVSKFHFRRWLI